MRQNVSSQHEVQRLRDREMELQADLNTASREIHRLRDGFVTSIVAAKSRQESVSRPNETSLTQMMEIFASSSLCTNFDFLSRRQRKVPEIASEVMISNRGPPPPGGPHIKRRS